MSGQVGLRNVATRMIYHGKSDIGLRCFVYVQRIVGWKIIKLEGNPEAFHIFQALEVEIS